MSRRWQHCLFVCLFVILVLVAPAPLWNAGLGPQQALLKQWHSNGKFARHLPSLGVLGSAMQTISGDTIVSSVSTVQRISWALLFQRKVILHAVVGASGASVEQHRLPMCKCSCLATIENSARPLNHPQSEGQLYTASDQYKAKRLRGRGRGGEKVARGKGREVVRLA
ncbi:hypothetical protein BDV93DRAFT_510693 [Ceratobasidium sp. AG-I]|nr:hypothetical protein BDV93DRAFT_510693 [Ceratobasidium sp. AG-I]